MTKKTLFVRTAGILMLTFVIAAVPGNRKIYAESLISSSDMKSSDQMTETEKTKDSGLAENETYTKTPNDTFGVVQVVMGYQMPDSSIDIWGTFTGTEVSDTAVAASKTEGMIADTNAFYQNVKETRSSGYADLGIDLNDFEQVRPKIVYRINDGSSDHLIECGAEDTASDDLLILKTEEKLKSQVRFEDGKIKTGGTSYNADFTAQDTKDGIYRTADEIVESPVTIENAAGDGKLTIKKKDGNLSAGSPVLNKEGDLLAVSLGGGNAITKDAVAKLLEDSGFTYLTRIEKPPLEMEALDNAIRKAEKLDLSGKTKETREALEQALSEGESVRNDNKATQKEIDGAEQKIEDAIEGLEDFHLYLTPYPYIAAGAAVFLAVLIVMLRKKKLEEEKKDDYGYQDPEAEEPVKPVKRTKHAEKKTGNTAFFGRNIEQGKNKTGKNKAPVRQAGQKSLGTGTGTRRKPARPAVTENRPPVHPIVEQNGFLEEQLTVDDEGDIPTNVLSRPDAQASLERIRTREKKTITLTNFLLGRDGNHTDYAIHGNDTIGRIHAEIIREHGRWYIRDLKSKNKTYVNGKELRPDVRTLLQDGDRIALSDEEFIFREE